jgi:hypothetical protein
VLRFTVLLSNFSLVPVWQFYMCSFGATDAHCFVVDHRSISIKQTLVSEETIDIIGLL